MKIGQEYSWALKEKFVGSDGRQYVWSHKCERLILKYMKKKIVEFYGGSVLMFFGTSVGPFIHTVTSKCGNV